MERAEDIVAIQQLHPGHAKMAGLVAVGCGSAAYLGRITIIVDDDIDVFDDDRLDVVEPYFRPEGHRWETPGSYAALDAPTANNATWEWTHPVGEVVTAVAQAGLQIEMLHEHPFTLWQRFPFLERHGDGTFHLPDDRPSLPMLYSLRARLAA